MSFETTQEIAADVLDPRFYLPLRLGPVRPAQSGGETPMPSEIEKNRIPDRLTAVIGLEPHSFHSVIQNFFWDASELPKSFFV